MPEMPTFTVSETNNILTKLQGLEINEENLGAISATFHLAAMANQEAYMLLMVPIHMAME